MHATVQHWIERDPDPQSRTELTEFLQRRDNDELQRRFGGRLQFGTAGLRGIVGAGPMRMNRLVVRETSAGLGDYVLQSVTGAAERGIVIAYDARPDSRQFAEDAACVFMGLGIAVHLTENAQPTPVGAYAVTKLNAAAGIVVTASHNPPQYNGYKVYWENGAQIIPPHDSAIAACIGTAAQQTLPWMTLEAGIAAHKLHWLDATFVDGYQQRVLDYIGKWRATAQPPITIAYTALHGVGAQLAHRLAAHADIGMLHSVAAQETPDGSFPTVAFPNPEEPGAMDAVIALAQQEHATLACANDPDADRLAVAARTATGDYRMLSGDQIGVLLGHYCLSKTDAAQQIVCASIVSSRLLGRIARAAGATYFETLTGFKWLSNVALQHQNNSRQFLFAYEEALGYALGQLVRDKDGLSALVLFCQMTAELAAQDRTVFDQLASLYQQHGLFLTHQHSIKTGIDQASITEQLRRAPLATIGGHAVIETRDLLQGLRTNAAGEQTPIDGHPTDTIIYVLDGDARIIVRPSGTEPKTKCYYEVVGDMQTAADPDAALAAAEQQLDRLVTAHQSELQMLLE
ncbi:MAG: phospho-sugar mutase [Pseudomonadota bacterium]